MSRVITSPSKRYPGTITLAYPLTFPQYAAWRRALESLPDAPMPTEEDERPGWRIYDLAADPEKSILMLPAIFELVEEWNLENVPQPPTPDNFPSTPPASVYKLLLSILVEINEIISEDDDVPFEQPAPPIATPIAAG